MRGAKEEGGMCVGKAGSGLGFRVKHYPNATEFFPSTMNYLRHFGLSVVKLGFKLESA